MRLPEINEQDQAAGLLRFQLIAEISKDNLHSLVVAAQAILSKQYLEPPT